MRELIMGGRPQRGNAAEPQPKARPVIRRGPALSKANRSAGVLLLKNSNGVIMHLVAKREGLMLSLGGDAVVIQMGQRCDQMVFPLRMLPDNLKDWLSDESTGFS